MVSCQWKYPQNTLLSKKRRISYLSTFNVWILEQRSLTFFVISVSFCVHTNSPLLKISYPCFYVETRHSSYGRQKKDGTMKSWWSHQTLQRGADLRNPCSGWEAVEDVTCYFSLNNNEEGENVTLGDDWRRTSLPLTDVVDNRKKKTGAWQWVCHITETVLHLRQGRLRALLFLLSLNNQGLC